MAGSGCGLGPHRRSLSGGNRLGGFVLFFDGLYAGARGLRSWASSSKIRPELGDRCHWLRRAFLTGRVCGGLRHRDPSACRSFSVDLLRIFAMKARTPLSIINPAQSFQIQDGIHQTLTLKYYASEEERKAFRKGKRIPEHVDPPYARDHLLPKA